MYLASHGGKCCGINHIYSVGYSPNQLFPARARPTPESLAIHRTASPMAYWKYMSNSYIRPAETAVERLRGLIYHFEQKVRKKGVIEVVLDPTQNSVWKETLEELQFKLVNTAVNSWQSNNIYIYHRNCGAKGVTPIPAPKPTPAPKEEN